MIGFGGICQDSSPRSWVSRLDPRIRILSILSFLVFILLSKGFPSILILTPSVVLFGLLSRCSLVSMLRTLKPFLWLVGVTFLLNFLLTPGRTLLHVWGLSLTHEGLVRGSLLSLKLLLMISVAHLLLLATSPSELTDGLLELLSPLKLLRLPVSQIGTVSALTLRLIPTFTEEAKRIFRAQRARGAFGGGVLDRMKGMLPFVLPLLSSCLQKGESLSRALESKGYQPEVRRPRSRGLSVQDYLALGVVWLVGFVSIWIGFRPGGP